MNIAIDINDVIQVVKKHAADSDIVYRGVTVDEYHAVLSGPSGQSLLAAWEQKRRDEGDHPKLEL